MGEEDTFENLKFLELDGVTLAEWEVGEESFPTLERLVLSGCHKLEEIPPTFGDIYSLKMIKVEYNRQLQDSAMMIKQYVEILRVKTDFRSMAFALTLGKYRACKERRIEFHCHYISFRG